MANISKIRRRSKRNWKPDGYYVSRSVLFAYGAALFLAGAALSYFFMEYTTRSYSSMTKMLIKENSELKEKYRSLEEASGKAPVPLVGYPENYVEKIYPLDFLWNFGAAFLNDDRLVDIHQKISILEEKFTAMEHNIDPKNSEILTIARLKDLVLELQKDQGKFQRQIENDRIRYEQLINDKLSSSRDSVLWLLAIIIPLILNLIYTAWKDLRAMNSDKGNDTLSSAEPVSRTLEGKEKVPNEPKLQAHEPE